MANMSDDFIGDVKSFSSFEDEDTKILERDSNMSEDNSVDVDLDDGIDEYLERNSVDSWDEVQPSTMDLVKPLLGMAALFVFYVAMWVH